MVKKEEKLSCGTKWKGSKHLEMIESVLCGRCYIVDRSKNYRT